MADMFSCFLFIFLFSLNLHTIQCATLEKKSWGVAKISYCNPKYVVECSTSTFKAGKKILTNITGTFIQPVGDNVSMNGSLETKPGVRVKFNNNFCDYLGQSWLVAFLQHQNVPMHFPCPYPSGKFHIGNIELPPSTLPVPVKYAKYSMHFDLYVISTKERFATMNIDGEIFKPKKTD